jgi:beta-alanine degradation protein BauB
VRVWAIGLKRGQRLGFHTHVLDYFWTSSPAANAGSHFSDGRVSDTVYKPGDFKQITFKEGEFMVHHLENIGDTELLFTTVEFLESPNAPLGPCHANVSAHPVVG